MKKIQIIAGMTFKEVMRKKILTVLLLFAAIFIASTRFFGFLAPGEELKFIADINLGVIRVFGMLIVVFICGGLIPREVETRTITTLLSKPLRRIEFLIGKFLGAFYAAAINVFIMSILLIGVIYTKTGQFDLELPKAILLILAELIVLSSIVLCVSTRASEIFNIIFGIVIFFIGHLTGYLMHMADRFDGIVMKTVLWTSYTVLPNFENFNIQNAIVVGTKVSFEYIGKVLSYGALYTVVMLILAYLFFNEREV